MTVPPPIALLLVSGPQGSGKTRLVNALLATGDWRDALAIADQAGATPLTEAARQDVADLDSVACACCRPGAFTALLERLVRDLDNGRRLFGRLIFETAAEADPIRLAGELTQHPYLSRRFRIEAVIVCLPSAQDAVSAETEAQIGAADVIVSNAPEAWRPLVRRLNPDASIVTPQQQAAIFAARFSPASRAEAVRRRFFLSNRFGTVRKL